MPGPVDLGAAAREVLVNLQSLVAETGARVEIGVLPTLLVEDIRARELFQSLIGNAIKYRRAGVVAEVRISARLQGGEWHFAVADNGIGIGPEYLEKVFVIFQRLDRSSAGSGLGLAICQRIVESMGVRIWVESELGAGSVFRFTLPA